MQACIDFLMIDSYTFFFSMEDSFTDHLAEIVVAEVNMMSSTTDSMASSLLGSSLGDSLTEKMSEGSTGSMEEIVNMLQHLSIKVGKTDRHSTHG